ncbi:MAG: neutral/alkaline non-lysosomal ceramidase N-terminal domain-containing protein [Bryobacteraceae bacterium]|nr:neutral/alkaline non-lysosomal ceramidase N-terminal domain-containing protein [Bryobacteraceae bacterium]
MKWAAWFGLAQMLAAADWKAALAKSKITPEGPIWMSGYAARTHASDGVLQELWAKALALEDPKGNKVVFITSDLIGFPRRITDGIAAQAAKKYGLERAQIVFNSSHTHSGPVVRPNLETMYDLPPEEWAKIDRYGAKLSSTVLDLIGASLGQLTAARITYHEGKATFAINRRLVNPNGPIDHTVPVLRVSALNGKLLGAMFGYSCHNTTLTGEFYQIAGDYAGYAQEEFERAHPGSVGMFLMLAGGDQNPSPRSKVELAVQHGKSLAAATEEAITKPGVPIAGNLRTAFHLVDLPLAHHTREDFEKDLHDPNKYKVRRAKVMLAAYDRHLPVRKVAYPVQAIRLGKTVTYVPLGGELVVDYALQTKAAFPKERIVVAGYSNDVMCYISNKRILQEGGYEAVDSMMYYGMPGPFAPEVEEILTANIRRVLGDVGLKP